MRYLLLLLALVLGAPLHAQHGPADPPRNGYWEAPFQHDLAGFVSSSARFEIVHMALIPRGPHRGQVVVWNVDGNQAPSAWHQRWSIVDVAVPGAPVFFNDELELPPGGGDLFCAGHAWTTNGELLVAGGTSRYGSGGHDGGRIQGGRLLYLYDPGAGANGGWKRQPDLAVDRWYPTVALLDTGELLIAGGTPDAARPDRNDYEVFAGLLGTHGFTRRAAALVPGPAPPADGLGRYPRLLQLENGEQFLAGYGGATAKMHHALAPGAWSYTSSSIWIDRKYVNAVMAPGRPGTPQRILAIGGDTHDAAGNPLGALDTVEVCEPAASGPPDWNWTALQPLHRARAHSNAVLLPDGKVLVIGGRSNPESDVVEDPVLVPELFDGASWLEMAPSGVARSYHSTAVLLPSGKVLTGGGATSTLDYQVFVPPYVLSRARPRIQSAPATLPYSSQNPVLHTVQFAPLPSGEFADRVVLIAPGSVTHHFDASQRYVELALETVTATSVSFRGPSHAALAPGGFYMLFVVTASGIPSVARWVLVG